MPVKSSNELVSSSCSFINFSISSIFSLIIIIWASNVSNNFNCLNIFNSVISMFDISTIFNELVLFFFILSRVILIDCDIIGPSISFLIFILLRILICFISSSILFSIIVSILLCRIILSSLISFFINLL